LGKFSQLFGLPRRHVGYTNFGTWGFANSIRPLCGQCPKAALLVAHQTKKLSPSLAHTLARTTMSRPRYVSAPGRALLLKTLHGYDVDHNCKI
jgi:hypothetical protein